jgi:hypothetical protein
LRVNVRYVFPSPEDMRRSRYLLPKPRALS